jgi:hypothetical protein
MTTYADMKTRIARELHRSDLSSDIALAIQSAISHYATKRFSFSEKQETVQTIAGQRYYGTTTESPGTLPTDIVEIDTISTTVNNRTYKLDQTSFEHLDSIDSGVTPLTGYPRLWAWYAGKIRVYPSPNDEYDLKISYHCNVAAPTADADTTAWMTTAEELIRNRAKKDLCLSVTHDDARAMACAAMEKDAFNALKTAANKLISSNTLRSTKF